MLFEYLHVDNYISIHILLLLDNSLYIKILKYVQSCIIKWRIYLLVLLHHNKY